MPAKSSRECIATYLIDVSYECMVELPHPMLTSSSNPFKISIQIC